MIPTRFALTLLLALVVLPILGFVDPRFAWWGLGADALLLALIVWDGTLARRTPLAIERSLPSPCHQGEPVTLTLSVANPGTRRVLLAVRETLAPELLGEPKDIALDVPPRSSVRHELTLEPRRRGTAALAPLAVRVRGPLGLAWAPREAALDQTVRIFPRKHLEGRSALLVRLAQERRLGTTPRMARGISHELYGLREYHPGDEYRLIHWKAAARFRRPVTRETRWEQHQRLVILVDCGRPMASLSGTMTKLDHTLAATIALLRVALAQEDEALLVLFGKEIRRVVHVSRRTRSFVPIFEAIYDEHATLDEPDYGAAIAWCAQQAPRRSLFMLCTSVLDLLAADQLAQALVGVAARHHTLLVNLEDPGLAGLALSMPETAPDAFAKAGALALVAANRELATRLAHRGVGTLSVPASQLTVGIIERYLDFKAQRRAG